MQKKNLNSNSFQAYSKIKNIISLVFCICFFQIFDQNLEIHSQLHMIVSGFRLNIKLQEKERNKEESK